MADHDEQLGKKDFADKCVPYKSLLREIDAQEKTSYLKRELSLYILFMVVFVHWVVSFSNVNNAFYLDRVVYSTLIDKRFPETNEPTNVNFLTFHEIDTRVRSAPRRPPRRPSPPARHRLASHAPWPPRGRRKPTSSGCAR